MATEAIQVVQAALAGLAAGKPEEYLNRVADDFEFSILGGLMPDELALGKTKEGFINLMGAMGDYFEQVSFTPHGYTGAGPHVGFIVDWEIRWIGGKHAGNGDGPRKGPIVPLRAVVYKKVVDGKICQKFHMIDQRAARMVKDSVHAVTEADRTPVEYGVAERVTRAALESYCAGKPEGYMVHVADNIEFSIMEGMLPDEAAVGKSKDDFMAVGEKRNDHIEVMSFTQNSWTGYGEYVAFLCEWQVKILKDGGVAQFHAVCLKKTDGDDKICQKWHLIDQYYGKKLFA